MENKRIYVNIPECSLTKFLKKLHLKKNLNDFDEYTCMITLLTKEAFSLFRICEFTIYNCQSLRETKTPTDPRLCNMTWLRQMVHISIMHMCNCICLFKRNIFFE